MQYWVSCNKFTVWVEVENETIKKTAPVVAKFIGQPFYNLCRWFAKFGGLQIHELGR